MSRYIFPNQLRVVCTDHGTHRTRELAVFTLYNPSRLRPAVGSRGRKTPAGERYTALSPVTITTRADGGETFELPQCPTCKGPARRLRHETLCRFLEVNPGGVLDVSVVIP